MRYGVQIREWYFLLFLRRQKASAQPLRPWKRRKWKTIKKPAIFFCSPCDVCTLQLWYQRAALGLSFSFLFAPLSRSRCYSIRQRAFWSHLHSIPLGAAALPSSASINPASVYEKTYGFPSRSFSSTFFSAQLARKRKSYRQRGTVVSLAKQGLSPHLECTF